VSADIRSTAELLPWLVPITDALVVCKDSSLLATYEFTGADADSVGQAEIYQVGQAAERMLLLLRDLPVTLWWTVRRERTSDYPGEPMPDAVSQMLDDEHRAQFLARSAFVNRHFLSLIWMPAKGTEAFFEKVGAMTADGENILRAIKIAIEATFLSKEAFGWKLAEMDRVINDFEQRLSQIENVMSALHMRRLRGSEFMGFLWAQANPGVRMTPKLWNGSSFFDAALSETPITVTRDVLQFGDGGEARYGSVISMKNWPTPIAFDAFGALVTLPTEMVISHCFRVMPNSEAIKQIDRAKAVNDFLKYPLSSWIIGSMFRKGSISENKVDPSREEVAASMLSAKADLNSGRVIFGWHNFSVVLLNEDVEALEASTRDMLRMLHGSPFVGALRESVHALSGWASTLPGQWRECRRWMTLSSANVTDLAPLLGVSVGERMNKHLSEQLGKPCQALTVLATDFNTPYYFNFHVGAIGHAFVIGPSRTGKSIGMNFLISQFRKYGPEANIIIFDKDYSCRIATLLQDGDHIDLRAAPESKVKINPMLLARDGAARPFLSQWVEHLIGARGYQVTSEDVREIAAAIEGLASNPDPAMHRLLTLRTLLPGHLGMHLDEWCGAGAKAHYFDNLEDSFSLSNFTCIEMGDIMRDARAARAFMDYAFYRIMAKLRDQARGPQVTMIYLEECWFLLEDARFAAQLMDWLKTLAKLNAFVVLTTQSIEDMVAMPEQVAASIRDNILTKIFLPNPMALTSTLSEFYRNRFALRDDHIHRIATAVPRQDYLVVQPEVSRMVRLPLTQRQVAALRSDIAAQRVFNRHWPACEPGWQMAYIRDVLEGTRQ